MFNDFMMNALRNMDKETFDAGLTDIDAIIASMVNNAPIEQARNVAAFKLMAADPRFREMISLMCALFRDYLR